MESTIKDALRLTNHPVAVIKTDEAPENALSFKKGSRGCVIALLVAASKGRTVAFSEDTCGCPGGKVGLGFGRFEPGGIEYFLSTGGIGPRQGEFYKKSPELARAFIEGLPHVAMKTHLLFKPLEKVEPHESPEAVVFLVNPDQLSALVTLANYDQPTQENVRICFGSGCAQAILYALKETEEGKKRCILGLTDPSARKCLDKDILSLSIPYGRFLELENQAEESFLTKATWNEIAHRL
ncbi:MAG: DUF169 domain-containing protein [Bilophila sp.]